MQNEIKEKAAEIFARESDAEKQKRIHAIEAQISAEHERAKRLAELESIAAITNRQALIDSVAAEAEEIAALVEKIAPIVRRAEAKHRAAYVRYFESISLASELGVFNKTPNPTVKTMRNTVARRVAERLKSSGHTDVANTLGYWLGSGHVQVTEEE